MGGVGSLIGLSPPLYSEAIESRAARRTGKGMQSYHDASWPSGCSKCTGCSSPPARSTSTATLPPRHYSQGVLMDGIFGRSDFKNEIAWCYRKWSVKAGPSSRLPAQSRQRSCGIRRSRNFYIQSAVCRSYSPGTHETVEGQPPTGRLRGKYVRPSDIFESDRARSPCQRLVGRSERIAQSE